MTSSIHPHSYRWCYETLGLPAGCEWDELRLAYRRKLRSCHPDLAFRDEGEPVNRERREEMFKETVRAFRMLAVHYRQYGRLPHPEMQPPPVRSETLSGQWRKQSRRSERRQAEPVRARRSFLWPSLPRFHQWMVGGFLVSVTVAAAANLLAPADSETTAVGRNAESKLQVGMQPAEVVHVQGVPNFTRGSVWFYGDSGVIFERGCVVGWENTTPFPLHTVVPVHSRKQGLASNPRAPRRAC